MSMGITSGKYNSLTIVKNENFEVGTGAGGAHTSDVFDISGCVRILGVFVDIATVNDATTFSGIGFNLSDGVDTNYLGTATLDLSGVAVDTQTLWLQDWVADLQVFANLAATNKQAQLADGSLFVNAGANSTIQFNWTEDVNTDVVVGLYVVYEPLEEGAYIRMHV